MIAARQFLVRHVERVNPTIVALIFTTLLAYIQHSIGIEISFSIFYLLPVTFISSRQGLGPALAWSIICALTWAFVDHHSGHMFSSPLIPVWNTMVRAAYFSFAALAVSRAKLALERQQDISELKSQMLSIVSHEFGNSLAIMKMGVHLLRNERTALPSENLNLLDMLDRGIDAMTTASANFLNRARLDSGKFSLDLKDLHLHELLGSVASLFQMALNGNKLDFKLSLPPGDLTIHADRAAMELILRNILGNAIKYTPAGGTIAMGVTVDDSDPARPHAVVWVQDSGIGISAEDQIKITSGFHRTEEGKARAKGYGVGLKVTHDLLISHSSRLEVLSSPGMGSRFSFRFPLASAL